MPLEDLTGTKFIEDLNPLWPIGGEPPVDGDNHIRGIKNVLQNQFPNLGAVPVSLTAAQINQGSVPVGTRAIFYQASAPAGWSRVPDLLATYGILIQATADAGGTSAGSDDPVLNNKVPSHTHYFSTTSGLANTSHVHYFSAAATTSTVGNHAHTYTYTSPATGNIFSGGSSGTYVGGQSTASTSAAGSHNHTVTVSGNTGGISANHQHAVSGDTNANGSASNWVPRHLKTILCERDALS